MDRKELDQLLEHAVVGTSNFLALVPDVLNYTWFELMRDKKGCALTRLRDHLKTCWDKGNISKKPVKFYAREAEEGRRQS